MVSQDTVLLKIREELERVIPYCSVMEMSSHKDYVCAKLKILKQSPILYQSIPKLRYDSVDVVICTKDRQRLLPLAIHQARSLIPCNRIIVVESSRKPDVALLNRLDVDALFTPDVPLGFARQEGLLATKTDLMAFLDDDVILEQKWFSKMVTALLAKPEAVGASSKVVFGYPSNHVLMKLHLCSLREQGASAGVSLLRRKMALELGGFNRMIHRSEDLEFELRCASLGHRWIRVSSAVAYHPLTFKQYIEKARINAEGWIIIWRTMKRRLRLRFLAYRAGSALLMPFYYGLLSCDPRVFGYAALYKWKMLLTFLWKVNGRKIR